MLGGWLAARWNGWGVLALAVFSYSLATLLTPLAAATSLPTLIACRVLLGMGEGCTLPALHHVTARWAPANERARFVTISVSGQYLGTSATLLCAPLVHVWWPSIFYIFGKCSRSLCVFFRLQSGGCTGGLGICWVVAWVLLGGDSAESHRHISDEERSYIAARMPPLPPVQRVPWRKLCCEPAFIAIYVCHFCVNWANYFIISWLPKYLVDVRPERSVSWSKLALT